MNKSRFIAPVFAALLFTGVGVTAAQAVTPTPPPSPGVTPLIKTTYHCGFPLGTFTVSNTPQGTAAYNAAYGAQGCTHTP